MTDFPELHIHHLSQKGAGIARAQVGEKLRQVEVAHTLPGEIVRAQLLCKKQKRYLAKLGEVLQPSPDRIEARCPHVAEDCGGCPWQHFDYPAQLKEKERRIRELFAPLLTEASLMPIIPAPALWHYRNKMEFTFSQDRARQMFLGLNRSDSHHVLNIKECYIGHPSVGPLLESVRLFWKTSGLKAYHPPSDEGTLRKLMVKTTHRTHQAMVILTVSGRPEFALKRTALDEFVNAVKVAFPHYSAQQLSIFLVIQQAQKGARTQFFEMKLDGPDHIVEEVHIAGRKLQFLISPSSFFQPNPAQAEVLFTKALEIVGDLSMKKVLDLYCGTGTFGLAMAGAAKEVIGIEVNPHAVFDAEMNRERNGILNFKALQGDVGQLLSQNPDLSKDCDLVLLDPPRTGLDQKALQALHALKAPAVLYVSCNPLSQARDIEEMVRQGYHLEHLQAIDQFPHTVHVENIAYLTQKAHK